MKDKINSKPQGAYYGQERPGLEPVMFAPGVISTGLNEGACTFTPDGKGFYYHIVFERNHKLEVSLVFCKEVEGKWTTPELIGFSGKGYFDGYPFLSYDGKTLYFSSNRPTNDSSYTSTHNIWYSEIEKGGWTSPQLLKLPTNGKDDVSGLSISKSGKYYYTLITEEQQAICYTEKIDGKFTPPVKLPGSVNSGTYQFDGTIAPDDSFMLLCAYGRDDSFGSTDMYVTFKNNEGQWSDLINLGEKFNSTEVDGPATITPDGKYIFFGGYLNSGNWTSDTLSFLDVLNYGSKPGYGSSDVYWVDVKVIGQFRPEGF